MELATLSALVSIVLIDLVLSGDNALVIGMAARALPPKQRKWAILGGTAAAIVFRVGFTLIVNRLLFGVTGLRLVGGLLLIWVAAKLLVEPPAEGEGVAAGHSLWGAIRIILVADVVMSLDNILSIAAAAGESFWLLVIGLALSIPILMGGATLVSYVMNRAPWLVWLGGAVIAWISGKLIVEEPLLHEHWQALLPAPQWLLPGALTALIVLGSYLWVRRRELEIFEIAHGSSHPSEEDE